MKPVRHTVSVADKNLITTSRSMKVTGTELRSESTIFTKLTL